VERGRFTTEPERFQEADPRKSDARPPQRHRRAETMAVERRRSPPPSLRRRDGIRSPTPSNTSIPKRTGSISSSIRSLTLIQLELELLELEMEMEMELELEMVSRLETPTEPRFVFVLLVYKFPPVGRVID